MFYFKDNIINVIVNIIYYDSKDVLPMCFRYISQNYYYTFSLLHIHMKKQDIIMDEKNQIKCIE